MFNGHKGDGDLEGELPKGDNGEGDRENGIGDCIVGEGQYPILKGEPLGEGEPNLFVSPISILGTAFTTNTKNNKKFLPLNNYSFFEKHFPIKFIFPSNYTQLFTHQK